MAKLVAVLRKYVLMLLGVFGLLLIVRGVSVVWLFASQVGFSNQGLTGMLGGLCLGCGAILLVFSRLGGSYRERAIFFLICLTLYSAAAGPEHGALFEWLVAASFGGLCLVCLRLLDIRQGNLCAKAA